MSASELRTGKLIVRLLGGFTLEDTHGHKVTIPNRKACALLAYLAVSQNSYETRERLAGLLWSEREDGQARASLRQCVKQLRAVFAELNFTGFKAERHEITLSNHGLSVDIDLIEAELRQDRVPPLLLSATVAPESILYGFEELDQALTSWLQVLRQNWHDRIVELLGQLLNRLSGDTVVARQAAQALVNVDHTHEEAQRRLIRHYADEGNIAAALRQYKLLWDLLDEEYDMEPVEETQVLIAEIKSGDYRGNIEGNPVAPAASAEVLLPQLRPTLPIIGVSRFVPGGPREQETYIVDGFRREMIAALVRFREWIVVEDERLLGSSEAPGPESRGPEPAIDYQLEGTFLRSSGAVRLIITLKDVASRRYIWSEQILLTLENWFDAQQDIVRRTAAALNIYLSVERLDRISGKPDVSLQAYDRWLRGQELTLEWRPEAHARAREIFKSVIQETPNFGRAASSLVQLENAIPLVHPGVFRSKERNEENVRMAKHAVQIDPLDSRAQLCLGWAYAINGQYDHAEINFGLASELNQNDSWTLVSSALGWAFCDRIETANRLSGQALLLGLSPSKSHWGYLATIKFLSADYPGCVEAAEQAEEALYNLAGWKASALYHSGCRREAEAEAEHFMDLIREHWTGCCPATDEDVAAWFLQCFPIRSPLTWRQLRDGLRGAGLPMSSLLIGRPQLVH